MSVKDRHFRIGRDIRTSFYPDLSGQLILEANAWPAFFRLSPRLNGVNGTVGINPRISRQFGIYAVKDRRYFMASRFRIRRSRNRVGPKRKSPAEPRIMGFKVVYLERILIARLVLFTVVSELYRKLSKGQVDYLLRPS